MLLVMATLIANLPLIIVILYVAASSITFVVYYIDKAAARNGRWRIKESTFHLWALLGGWPGAFYAQNSLRHKTSKGEFKIVFWVTVVVNISGLMWLLNNGVVMI